MTRILLIGDNCIDEYQYGTVDRISPEAPVPIFKYLRSETKMGMASNVKKNLENLLIKNSVVDFITTEPSKKIRLVDERTNHHIARIDLDVEQDSLIVDEKLIDSLVNGNYDSVVISDYNKGFLTYDNIKQIRRIFKGSIFLDTKKPDLNQFENFFIKINEDEYKKSISTYGVGSRLIVTRGSRDVELYFDDEYSERKLTFEVPKIEAFDVCGAGDTFLATLASIANIDNIHYAIVMAILAASITIKHFGVYAPTLEELTKVVDEYYEIYG